ncbi:MULTISPECIES: type II secretion system protein N [Pseudomonas]|uniref:General secretion pathway protein GspC n=1 Tax=Pseudomonas lactucae TaxID=2813360 RepID=A0A9X1C416_9PSED|nr:MULTISPECIES: type II secretion system protein N [Pseudomonas]AZE88723.1 General secretion pathway protein C [Pseudomonas orientalis]MBN2975934.1 general secretion pathway protein GspC [Pseudomonas lactucae]MBN2985652.1 general secretion pathway protein GspC [Pseudomonas lactucae]WLI08970.1 type II secretion system protein N [Pseudomonas sp. FP597]
MVSNFRLTVPRLLQTVALATALVGVLVWSSVLLTSAESQAPQVEPRVLAARPDTTALQWFSNQPAAVDIKVSGVMAGARGAVAILSLNEGPPRSFLVGESLAQGVRLAAIEADGVVIERGSQNTRITVSTLPDAVVLPRLTQP